MSDALQTNSANRAVILLHKFRQSAPPPSDKRNQRTVRHALARMYGYDIDDTSMLMQIIGELWRVPGQIRMDLGKIESLNPTPFNRVVTDLEKVLSGLILDSDAVSVANSIPHSLESSLEMISAYLDIHCPEALPSKDNLKDLLGSVSQLMEDIKSADLDNKFTDFFLHRLDELHYALNHYDTLGPHEVLRKVDEIFGSLLRQYPSIRQSSKKQDIAKSIFNIGTAILLAIQLVNGSFELAENYQHLLVSEERKK
ncbi:MAG: hypothetical protein HZB75_00565 [Candidatus Saccharibacteria bacterium]|nr:MAG: hypothetical protein HZB75_00565 [Candidatus Saccharibacteria bacterium]